MGVSSPPCLHQWLHFCLWHLRAHSLQSPNTAPITAGKRGLFSLLPVLIVWMPLDNRFLGDMIHTACRCLVDPTHPSELIKNPVLPSKPRKHTCFYGRKISHDKLAPIFRDKGSSDQFRECIGYGTVKQLNRIDLAIFYDFSCQIQVRQMILRNILQLYQAAGPSS